MRTIMSKSVDETSFSFSRRYLNWKKKPEGGLTEDENDKVTLTFDHSSSSHSFSSLPSEDTTMSQEDTDLKKSCVLVPKTKKVLSVSKFRSFFTKSKSGNVHSTLGSKVVGTLFGFRRGHVHIAFQDNSKSTPAFLIELSTPTSVLVREMASGLVRVALECDKKYDKKGLKLLEEPLWRAYCNGKKCGYAMRRECGPEEWRVLNAVGPITMGAGVLPACGDGDGDGDGDDSVPPRIKAEGELMYMRAKFERIVGSKDSEAFYMMNPDGNGGPELSVYLLRV
ncbi:protein MIZU-KUSSEI 1 [Silene latifolia]|uniref:protein MIZU-KUSSEI 1 n=1 Tax=Silene latifolia TaxID=37657 RepID=UPI003D76CDD6